MAAKFFTGLPLDGPDPECVRGHGEAALAAVQHQGTTGPPRPAADHSHRPVPVTTGRRPVPVTIGHSAVPVTTGHSPVPVTTGHSPVPVTIGRRPPQRACDENPLAG